MDKTRVLAIGFFDGVHLGHGALLRTARREADRLGLPAAALTFDRHPGELITGRPAPLLSTPEERAGLMRRLYGMDEVLLHPFDRAMMELPWRTYVRDFLCTEQRAAHVVCGHDHRFGWRGEGNPARLRQLCGELGRGCTVVPKVELDGVTVSSTHIRALVAAGDMEAAARFLGHPHCLTGPVVPGRQLGRKLGTPTANVLMPEGVLPPAFGVYAATVDVDGRRYPAVTNVGVRPTVAGGGAVTVEPWLLDFDGDLYGKTIRVEFHRFLRAERKFASLEELKAAILRNAGETRAYFAM